jgi:LemA protein
MITIPILAALVLIVWITITFNLLIRDRNMVREAWSGIDVQLKRRHNLIPNLVETVKGYSNFEKKLLQDLTEKRSMSTMIQKISDKAVAENDLSGMIKSFFAVVENYPDLKAAANFLDLQKQLAEIEDQIQYARRYYNGAVRNYNIRVESFPSNLIASSFGFKGAEFFEIELATEKNAPGVII